MSYRERGSGVEGSRWWPADRVDRASPVQDGRRPARYPVRSPKTPRRRTRQPAPVAEPAPGPSRWSGLIDLHCHVLPGLDDGARDLDEAMRMLRIAGANGIQTVVATPHADRCRRDRIEVEVQRLNRYAREAGVGVAIFPGSEVRLAADLPARQRAGQLATLNSTPYLLLELSLRGSWPPYLRQVVYELQVAQIWPVLAHAERYPAVQRDPGILADLIVGGLLVQINADSLLGAAGRHARRTAESLVRGRLAHVIATDAHNADSRPPRLQAALEHASALAGAEYVRWMVATSAAIARGDPVSAPDPAPVRGGSWLDRLRHPFSGA